MIEVYSIKIDRYGNIVVDNTIATQYKVKKFLLNCKEILVYDAISLILCNTRVLGEYDSINQTLELFYFGEKKEQQ